VHDYVLVLPLDSLHVGDSFSRQNWPLHVTILGNFRTNARVDDLARTLQTTLESQQSIAIDPVVVGEQALFGPGGDVVVNVVDDESQQLAALHQLLLGPIDEYIELLDAQHALSGYRPHVTAVASARVHRGDRIELRSLALVDLDWIRDDSLTRVVWVTELR